MLLKDENKTITIGTESVKPGQEKLVSIKIDRLPTGTIIDIPIYVFNAKNPGPTLLVQAGLHGDEINGIEIVRRMLDKKYFNVNKGCIIAVPILNIFGFIHFSRELPDGKDVNRSFPGSKSGSLASRIAYHFTKEIFPQIDFGVDLHTGGGSRSNYPQTRYTAADKNSEELAAIFNAPFTFSSDLIPKSFRKTAFTKGIPTIVYEAGESMRFDEYSIEQGVQGILNILHHFKMINKTEALLPEKEETVYLTNRKWLRAPTAGMFLPKIKNGSDIKKGAVIGIVTDAFSKRNKEIKAPFNGCVFCINHQAVVNQGEALFHIGELAK
ncbi:succinylglutamate desuccinylase [Cellulophaga geojensis KL-A]|uniref:Succinylglutamate desuccinylase n=1 Tax=Cellulophaga geojensis KL-A TaxID=1328323 RepID=A0ABP3B9N2_9FLAO|nr:MULTISPECIES: succinylglutamate desuccinylase/aspartoacylase family protein [Cellulophaga]APU10141.1 succinylglutamate desuccinylase [Cellulophaga lytica]EWH14495.1 succinylglutamate desuccinylase [Cellulophaga geojensis KL-A]MDO6852032.1 succinylglutamate desuccinylase/aspartoacylase family protein [Cellulophaga lytica]